MTIEITTAERGLLLRTLNWLMKQQDELPFTERPKEYWICNKLRKQLFEADEKPEEQS